MENKREKYAANKHLKIPSNQIADPAKAKCAAKYHTQK